MRAFFLTILFVFSPSIEAQSLENIQSEFFDGLTEYGKSQNGKTIYRLNTVDDYANIRKKVKEYGLTRFFQEMSGLGIFGEDETILPASSPFNVFAKIILDPEWARKHVNYPNYFAIHESLTRYDQKFKIAHNRPEEDQNWNVEELASRGKASMSKRHRFLIPRDPYWMNFNILTMGMGSGDYDLPNTIAYLKEMKRAAKAFTEVDDQSGNWSQNIGLFFHCFPLNSVQYLHLHIVDLDFTGPAFGHYFSKNISIDTVIQQLENEMKNR